MIDFDSTFIKLEALDELAKIALENDSRKEEKTAEIQKITNRGMVGEISFPESLQSRLDLFSIKREHIEKLIKKLKGSISESFLRNRDFFLKNKEHIYIISGGFLDYILPVAQNFGISKEHILANRFVFEGEDVIGFDKTSFLAQESGKVKAVKNLGIGKVVVVGDGWTDYEIKETGNAENFFAFSENVKRVKVIEVADVECFDLEQVIEKIKS
ncbi:hypothetical protein HN399_01730 [bacterium]|nr:hypothetical protein [bacterium]